MQGLAKAGIGKFRWLRMMTVALAKMGSKRRMGGCHRTDSKRLLLETTRVTPPGVTPADDKQTAGADAPRELHREYCLYWPTVT